MVKNQPAMRETQVSVPGLGRSPGGGHGNPLQCSCLENPMDRRAWRATVHGVTESQIGLSACACTHTHTYTHTQCVSPSRCAAGQLCPPQASLPSLSLVLDIKGGRADLCLAGSRTVQLSLKGEALALLSPGLTARS